MNRDKQIEEMLNEICVNCKYLLVCEDKHLKQVCRCAEVVKVLYDKGYRKHKEGEWIKRCTYSRNWDSFYDLTCPQCGAVFRDISECEISCRYKSCPVCGMKMKGE